MSDDRIYQKKKAKLYANDSSVERNLGNDSRITSFGDRYLFNAIDSNQVSMSLCGKFRDLSF